MNDKIVRIIAIVMAVITLGTGAAFFLTKEKEPEAVITEETAYSYENSEYTAKVTDVGEENQIFLPTGLDNLYYTLSLKNECKFYEWTETGFTASALEVKKVSAKLSATYETIPVTVSYVVKDGKTFGCGLFTADMDSSSDVYDFAFVKLTDKPKGYGEGYLLLADFNKEDLYRTDKVYSEIYDYSLNGSARTYVSNNTRLIDKNGTFRQDWTMLTDEFIANLGDKNYFISSRYYSEDETGSRGDIMVLSNRYRPEIVAKDIAGTWFVSDKKGLHYLKNTDDGFVLVTKSGDKEKKGESFKGDIAEDYLICGNKLINKMSLEMTDLLTGDKVTLKDINLTNAGSFVLSPDGTKAVVTFPGIENKNGVMVQTVVYFSVDGETKPSVYTEPLLFDESTGFYFVNNSKVISVRPAGQNSDAVKAVSYEF